MNTLKPDEKFNPSGNCKPGGIYFAAEDIFEFLNINDYVYVREVTLPADAQIYKNPGNPEKWKADKVILGRKRKLDDVKTIQWMLDNGARVNGWALEWASRNGYTEIVKLFIKNGAKATSWALAYASRNGHYEFVKLLLENGAKVTDTALTWASRNGHTKVVELLKKHMKAN